MDAGHVEIKEAKPAKSLKEWLKLPGLYQVLNEPQKRLFCIIFDSVGTRDLPWLYRTL